MEFQCLAVEGRRLRKSSRKLDALLQQLRLVQLVLEVRRTPSLE